MTRFMINIDDWLGSVKILGMTAMEECAFFRLLLVSAKSGDCSLPADDRKLANYARLTPGEWGRSKRQVLDCFEPLPNGRWRNVRLYVEWRRQRKYTAERSRSGLKGAKSRWQMNSSAMAEPIAEPSASEMAEPSKNTHKQIAEPLAEPSKTGGKSMAEPMQVREVGEEERTPTSVGISDSVVSKERKTHTLSPFYDHSALYERLVAIYPPGHNPRPDFAVQMLISKLDSGFIGMRGETTAIELGEEMCADLRDKWLPRMKPQGWQTPHDLHNWISRWEPGADVAPDPEPETREEQLAREVDASRREEEQL